MAFFYSTKDSLEDKLTEHSVVIPKADCLALLRKRSYIFKDALAAESGCCRIPYYFLPQKLWLCFCTLLGMSVILVLFQTSP
jgi:hypothetical protein